MTTPSIIPTPEKSFPILREEGAAPYPTAIPWSIADLAFSEYNARYGGQTLERLAERGGFAPSEMDNFLPGWRDMCSEIIILKRRLHIALAALDKLNDMLELGPVLWQASKRHEHAQKLIENTLDEIKSLAK